MKVTNIIFIRHADVDYQKFDYKGKYIDLSPEGWEKTITMTDSWSLDIDHVFTSPLNRCIETVLPLSLKTSTPIVVVDDLQELDYKGSAPMFHKMILDNRNFHYPGGETIAQANIRFYNAVLSLAKQNVNRTIVISTHGTVLSEFFIRQFNFDEDYYFKLEYPDIFKITWTETGFKFVEKMTDDSIAGIS